MRGQRRKIQPARGRVGVGRAAVGVVGLNAAETAYCRERRTAAGRR